MKGSRWIFFSACLGMLLFGISLITLGSVASGLQTKFQLDPAASGTLFSILPFGILTGSLLFGPFCDRYGYKFVLILSCLFLFSGFQGIAYADTLYLLEISVFIFGVAAGVINGATNAVVSDISETNKAANLSLLGVFFAVGALGMPFVLGFFEGKFSFVVIVSFISYIALLAAVLYVFIKFPAPKQSGRIPIVKGLTLLKDSALLLIGFFLFCQSSIEGVINNWTTTYLPATLFTSASESLYALSLYVAGMAVMRLMIGSVLRNISPHTILAVSLGFLLAGFILLQSTGSYPIATVGLIFVGVGLAAGFPVMLAFVGDRFARLSGTAFSLVLTMALLGNMAANVLMGLITEKLGIHHLTTVSFIFTVSMIFLSFLIRKKLTI